MCKETVNNFSGDKYFLTYVYDIKTGQSYKIAGTGTKVFFSNDDSYMIYYEDDFKFPVLERE